MKRPDSSAGKNLSGPGLDSFTSYGGCYYKLGRYITVSAFVPWILAYYK